MDQVNNPVPSYYISDMQYSRLYALAYLDDMLRKTYPEYPGFAADKLSKVRAATGHELIEDLVKLLGGKEKFDEFIRTVPDAATYFERYVKHTRHLNPEQPFKDAFEENQLWASTNSIVYILVTQEFDRDRKQNQPHGGVFQRSVFDPEHQANTGQRILLNMMFINTVRIDPVPSVLDGYSFSLLHDIINDKDQRAITLPSNATCC